MNTIISYILFFVLAGGLMIGVGVKAVLDLRSSLLDHEDTKRVFMDYNMMRSGNDMKVADYIGKCNAEIKRLRSQVNALQEKRRAATTKKPESEMTEFRKAMDRADNS